MLNCCPHVDKCSTAPLSADLLQEFLFLELKLHADGHFCDELVTALLGHLLAVAQVDVADAPAAFEIGQRQVGDPVAHCREKPG